MKRMHFLWLLAGLALLSGCAATVPTERAKYTLSDFEQPGATRPLAVSDPIETVNRGLYRFNYNFDRFVFLPIVNTYEFILPNYVEHRVSNFMDNIGEFRQLHQRRPAAQAEIRRHHPVALRDQQHGRHCWLVGPGHPLGAAAPGRRLRPDSRPLRGRQRPVPRAAGVRAVEPARHHRAGRRHPAFNAVDPLNFEHNEDWELPYQGVKAVDTRHRQPFRYFQSGSPFEYELVRLLYTEKRKLQIAR